MTSAIQSPPNSYDFGYEFDYSLWTAGTTIDLFNVAWNNDYRDVVKFTDSAALDAYLNSLSSASLQITNMSYVKPGQPIRINIPHNRAIKYNYLRASNPLQPIEDDIQKNYYYFILDATYIAPNTTEVTLQLDVWQTYIYNVTIGNCFVERGHVGIANSNAFNNYGRDYLTNPEGFDLGTDLRIVTTDKYALTTAAGDDYNSGNYSILIVTTVSLDADPGDATNPHLYTAVGGVYAGMSSGAAVYVFANQTTYSEWLSNMSDKPWVTQGIVASMIIPPVTRYWSGIVWEPNNAPTPLPGDTPTPNTLDIRAAWRNTITNALPARYQGLKKFLTFPYCIVEMTTLTGNPIVIKPELWMNDDATVRELVSLLPPNAQISFYPEHYNGTGIDSVGSEGMDHATNIVNLPTMSIVNNMAISYLASNRNSINYQYTSADWSQQKAMTQNNLAQRQGNRAADVMNDNAVFQRQTNAAQTNNTNRTLAAKATVDLGTSMLSAGSAAVGSLNPVAIAGAEGAAMWKGIGNGIDTGIQMGANHEATILQNRLNANVTDNNVELKRYLTDTNKSMADFAAKGDYANAIAGIVAKTRDAQMIQPGLSGQQGGEIFNFVHDQFGVYLHYKMIDNSAVRRIGEYWLRYGYAVETFMAIPPTYQAMTKFTYWKLTETYIANAQAPEGFKQIIRGIFEKGVTVWVNPADIGVIDWATNAPLPGISY